MERVEAQVTPARFRHLAAGALDGAGVVLLVFLLWRVFFTTSASLSVLAASIAAAGISAALLNGRPVRTAVDIPIACYLVFTLASSAIHYGRYPALAGLIPVAPWHPGVHLVLVVVYFYGVVALVHTERRLGLLMAGITIAVSAIGVIAVYDHARFGLDHRIWEYLLLPQWLGYPHIGLLLAVAFPIPAAVASATASWAVVAAAGTIAVVFVAMATTLYSRSAVFAIVVAFVALCGVEWRRNKTYRLRVVAVAIALIAIVALTASGRVLSLAGMWVSPEGGLDFSTSVFTRGGIWTRTAALIRDHPLFGVGPGSYTNALESGYAPPGLRENGHAHNMVLHVAAEQGVPAAIAFVIIWWRLGAALARRSGRLRRGVLATACLGALVAFFARSMTDHFLPSTGSPSERTAFVMWTLLAAAAAIARVPSDREISQ